LGSFSMERCNPPPPRMAVMMDPNTACPTLPFDNDRSPPERDGRDLQLRPLQYIAFAAIPPR
jgi:hypothetical protein